MSDRNESTLANARWRIAHSGWIVAVVAGFGVLTGPAFLYVGIRAGRKHWSVAGVIYWIALWTSWPLFGESAEGSTLENVAGTALFGSYIISIIHASIIHPEWLRWNAENIRRSHVWHPGSERSHISAAARPAIDALGLTPDVYRGAEVENGLVSPIVAPDTVVDVNTADRDTLGALPGMSLSQADAAISHRNARGRFRHVDEFAVVANMPPHVYAVVRTSLICSANPRHTTTGPRILDV